jgi:hypothetical protein
MNNLAKAFKNDRHTCPMLLMPLEVVFISGYVPRYGYTVRYHKPQLTKGEP